MHLVSDSELVASARPLEMSTAKTPSSTQSSKAKGVICTKLGTKGVCVSLHVHVHVCLCMYHLYDLNQIFLLLIFRL